MQSAARPSRWTSPLTKTCLKRPRGMRLFVSQADLVQRRSQSLGELLRVIVRPEVHKEEPRLLLQHVTVQRGDLDAVVAQCFQHWIDLFRGEHEVAGDGRLA